MSWCPHLILDGGKGPVLGECGKAAHFVPILGIPALAPPGSPELQVFDIALTEKYCEACAPHVSVLEILERTPPIMRAVVNYFQARGWELPDWDKALVTFVGEKAAQELSRSPKPVILECQHCRLRDTAEALRAHSCVVVRATKRGLKIPASEPLDLGGGVKSAAEYMRDNPPPSPFENHLAWRCPVCAQAWPADRDVCNLHIGGCGYTRAKQGEGASNA